MPCSVQLHPEDSVVTTGSLDGLSSDFSRCLSDEEGEFEVEEIIDVRYCNGEPEFLIKWKNHPGSMNSWEPYSHLNCPALLQKFYSRPRQPQPTFVDVPDDTHSYGFGRGLPPESIKMVTKKNNELFFLIKWKGTSICDVVPATQAYTRCPQVVIKFYESILYFT